MDFEKDSAGSIHLAKDRMVVIPRLSGFPLVTECPLPGAPIKKARSSLTLPFYLKTRYGIGLLLKLPL